MESSLKMASRGWGGRRRLFKVPDVLAWTCDSEGGEKWSVI